MTYQTFIKRLILGAPLLIPAYGANLLTVFALVNIFHYTTFGIFSAIIIGDIMAYCLNVYLTPWILLYMKKTHYFTKEELTS